MQRMLRPMQAFGILILSDGLGGNLVGDDNVACASAWATSQ